MLDFERFKYHEKFFVVDIVVELGWGKTLRVKGDWMNFTVSQRYGGKDSSQGIVRGVHFNDKRCAWNPVGQDWHSGEGLLQRLESRVALIGEVPSGTFMSEMGQQNGDFRVVRNETLIEIGEAQERLDIFDLLGFRPILNDLDIVGGHSEAAQREYMA